MAIDMFGTQQVTLEQLVGKYGTELRGFVAAMSNDANPDTEGLMTKLGTLGEFAAVTPALVTYVEPQGRKCYLTIDFVDRADAAWRMPFAPRPTGTYRDPEGLLADWHAYESKVHALFRSGQMSSRRVDCAAFHCLGDPMHPEIKALVDRFEARVPGHVAELAAILRDDGDASHRAAAAYLLAYSNDGPALVELLVPAFRDAESLVRNNAMRVVADIAMYHPEIEIPAQPVLDALEYPATLDRNKAAAILASMLEQPGAFWLHPPVIGLATKTLLAMLRLQQPNNHDFAYRILKALSGERFGERDYTAWETWLRAQGYQPVP